MFIGKHATSALGLPPGTLYLDKVRHQCIDQVLSSAWILLVFLGFFAMVPLKQSLVMTHAWVICLIRVHISSQRQIQLCTIVNILIGIGQFSGPMCSDRTNILSLHLGMDFNVIVCHVYLYYMYENHWLTFTPAISIINMAAPSMCPAL